MRAILLTLVIIAAIICSIDAQYERDGLLGRVRPLIREYESHRGRYQKTNRQLAARLDQELRVIRELERELSRASRTLDQQRYRAYEQRYFRHQSRLKELLG
ncbi:unnamed protein product [Oppiella nova]|uniref:Uncharacterized protein n=1 Tax=Oppiella nova TaxID=334625 RepID=A0A7R9MG35_9ACAR|nr:unnamed protein product [Oppiella nova]CAG2176728.1 unnamed protein product [Oppiella nova]